MRHPTTADVSPETPSFRQLELFATPRRKRPPAVPHQVGSATSKAAGESVRDVLGERQRIALAILRGRGARGATREELATATGWLLQSICGLVNTLVRQGLVTPNGVTRPTRTGRQAEILVSCEARP